MAEAKKLGLAVLAFLGLASMSAAAQTRATGPDAGLYTDYRSAGTQVSMDVCGQLQSVYGCYFHTALSGFDAACAVMPDDATSNGNVVTQQFYVLDKRSSGGQPVTLYVYSRTDTITDSFDTVVVTLRSKVQLPFDSGGGPKARCSMVSNGTSILASTDLGSDVYVVNKSSLAVKNLGVGKTKSMTADGRGFVFVNRGSSGVFVVGPAGVVQATATPHYFLIDSSSAMLKK